jgi:phage-related protein
MAGSKRTIWGLALEISGQDKGAKEALRTVRKQIQDVQAAAKQVGADFKTFAGNASKLALGVAGGITAAGIAVVGLANQFADVGDKVAKTSAALGVGVEAYQGMSYAMQQSGLSAEEFDGALKKFNLTVKQGAAGNEAMQKQLAAVGLSAQKLAGMKPEQAMMRLSDYLQSLPNDAERTRTAVTLFGKEAGPKMMAAMKQGSAGIQELMKEAHSLGIVLSEEQAHQSEAYKDAQNRLMQSVTGMKNQFIGGAIGPLTEAFDHLKNAILEQMPAIQELGKNFGQWLGDLVKRLPEIIAKIKEFGSWVKDTAARVVDFVGGFKNLAKILAGLAVAPTLISGLKVVWSFGNLINSAIGAWPKILAKIAPAFGGISAAVLPVIGIIAGLALVIYTVVKNFDTLKQYALECIERIKSAFSGATGGMAVDWQKVGETIKTVLGTIVMILEKTVLFAIKTIMNAITSAIQIVIGVFKVLWNVVKLILWPIETVIKVIIGLFTSGWSGAIDALGSQFGKLGEIFTGIFNGWKTIIGGVVDFFKNYFRDAVDIVKGIIGGLADKFGGVFNIIKEKIEAFINFFTDKIGIVKDFFSGIGNKIGNFFGDGNKKSAIAAHAEGGIFTHRHIAEIAERGAEAVVPLNNTPHGFDVWKQAGLIGGYLQKMGTQTTTGVESKVNQQTPPIMAAAAQKISSGNMIHVEFNQNFSFTGGAQDKEIIQQIRESGEKAADDFVEKYNALMRQQRRLSYA